jgi:hypothetical protein
MTNARGSITVDYLFAFFLVSGFCLAVITFSATLSMVEVVQYMTFASARNYFSGNVSEPKQKEAAAKKFGALKANPVIAPLLNGGWFEVPENSYIVDYNISKYPGFEDYEPDPGQANLFEGVVVTFNAKLLDFQVPFFGGTKKKDRAGNTSSAFETKITSFLGREPSFQECSDFNDERWKEIKKLPNSIGAAPYSTAPGGDTAYIAINDNGC